MFNPLTKKSYDETVESWTAAFFTLLTLLPQHPQVQSELHLPAAAVPSDGGDGGAGALGRRGGIGAGDVQQQQQQQPSQQEQPGSTAARETAGIDTPSVASEGTATGDASSGDSASSADKAVEIASALKEHLQQQEGAEGQKTGEQQEAEQQQQQQQQQAAATAGVGGDTPAGGHARLPVRRGTQRSRSSELLCWLLVILTGAHGSSALLCTGGAAGRPCWHPSIAGTRLSWLAGHPCPRCCCCCCPSAPQAAAPPATCGASRGCATS